MAKNKNRKTLLSELSLPELQLEAKKLKLEISKVGLMIRSKKEKNTRSTFNLRRYLAQALTRISEKILVENSKKGV